MIDKGAFLEFAISKFTKFGSKRFTLDDLASEIGVSKKTIYQHFSNKEAIVCESLKLLLDKIKLEILSGVEKEKSDPIVAIICIYKIGLDHLRTFSPTFLFGLKKYYPKANEVFYNFRAEINLIIVNLLTEAQQIGIIRNAVNLELTFTLFLNEFELNIFLTNNLFEKYSNKELLQHLIVHNLQGICSKKYSNTFFE
ncbi:MAG: TetR/AcrR family transcriptional regulator [Flavobacteriaceae bacterium]